MLDNQINKRSKTLEIVSFHDRLWITCCIILQMKMRIGQKKEEKGAVRIVSIFHHRRTSSIECKDKTYYKYVFAIGRQSRGNPLVFACKKASSNTYFMKMFYPFFVTQRDSF